MKSDLLDFNSVENEIANFAPDLVVHLAARTEVEKSFYEQISFSEVNYVGTVNLIESASKLTKKPVFLFASTMEVYGWQPVSDLIQQGNPPDAIPAFNEKTIPHPNAPYAVAKFGCEKYLEYAQRAHGLDYIIIRQTNSYGRKDNDFFVTEQIISQMITNDQECNLGYGSPYRNFIYIDDSRTPGARYAECLYSWGLLETNGIMAINDYLGTIIEPGTKSVNDFLDEITGQYTILEAGYRLFIKKLKLNNM
jgi:nucleoside-diphosphate-sugar epimerase